jgi:hypothetical protein
MMNPGGFLNPEERRGLRGSGKMECRLDSLAGTLAEAAHGTIRELA